MKTEKIVEQLELYSNAITGFMVAQSIAFAFTFGTSETFSCEFTRYKFLSAGLLVHFVFSSVIAGWALRAISRRVIALYRDGPESPSPLAIETLQAVTLGKCIIVLLFALIPMGLLVGFGLLGNANDGRCVSHALPGPAEKVVSHLAQVQPQQKQVAPTRPLASPGGS